MPFDGQKRVEKLEAGFGEGFLCKTGIQTLFLFCLLWRNEILLTPPPPDNNNRDRDSEQTSLGCMQKQFFCFRLLLLCLFPRLAVCVCAWSSIIKGREKKRKKKMGERESSPVWHEKYPAGEEIGERGGVGSKGGVISPPPSTFSFSPPRSARRLKDCLAMHVVFVAKNEGKRSKCGKDKIFSHFFYAGTAKRKGGGRVKKKASNSPVFYCQSDDFLLRPGRPGKATNSSSQAFYNLRRLSDILPKAIKCKTMSRIHQKKELFSFDVKGM